MPLWHLSNWSSRVPHDNGACAPPRTRVFNLYNHVCHWHTHGGGGEGGGCLLPQSEIKRKTDFFFQGWYQRLYAIYTSATEIGWWLVLWNIEKYNKNWRIHIFFSFLVIFNFLYNLTRCRLRDFDVIFHNLAFEIRHKLYIASGSAPSPSPHKKKFCVSLWSSCIYFLCIYFALEYCCEIKYKYRNNCTSRHWILSDVISANGTKTW